MNSHLLMIASAWIGYFVLHSLLASDAVKSRFTGVRCYRLIYNLIALVTLLPIAGLHALYEGGLVIQWQGLWRWLALFMTLGATACFVWTLRYYDLGEFSGWGQCRKGESGQRESRLVISPPHRYVRHPWYSCALVVVWCRDMDLAQLISTVLISTYFVIGSRLEERRLIAGFGDSYREYIREVPGLIPLPWLRISRERAGQLMNPKHPEQHSPAAGQHRQSAD